MDKAHGSMGQAGHMFAQQRPDVTQTQHAPGKTAGGALGAAGGMAVAGAQAGMMIPGVGPGVGAGVGAGIGFLSYMLS